MADDDDQTTDTGTVKTMAIMAPDGTCTKHPSIKIREVHADGTIYQRESCPECDKEYNQNKQQLEQRKEELNRQMKELEEAQQASEKKKAAPAAPGNGGGPPPGAYPPYGGYPGGYPGAGAAGGPPPYGAYPPASAVDPTVQRMQELQEYMLRQKEDECKFLRQKVDEQSVKLQESSVEIALLKEKLIQQEKLFEQDKKIVKLQAEADARKVAQEEAKDYIKTQTEFLVKAASAASAGSSVAASGVSVAVPAAAAPSATSRDGKKFDQSASDSMWNSDVMLDVSKNMDDKKAPEPVAVAAVASSSSTAKSASSNGSVPHEFSTDTPGTVPLTEDITYGTNVAATANAPPPAPAPAPPPAPAPAPAAPVPGKASASDVFQPKYVSEDEKAKEAAAAAAGAGGTPSTNNAGGVGIGPEQPPELLTDEGSLGNTVASSTYGEDRQKVVKQPLLDPYGDKGIYTGVVLRSTGMPHGLGRMVYEEDGRIYEGDWYVSECKLLLSLISYSYAGDLNVATYLTNSILISVFLLS